MLQKPKPTLSDGYPYQNRFKKNTLKTPLMSPKAAALDQKKLDHSPSRHRGDIDKDGEWSYGPHSTIRAIRWPRAHSPSRSAEIGSEAPRRFVCSVDNHGSSTEHTGLKRGAKPQKPSCVATKPFGHFGKSEHKLFFMFLPCQGVF